MKKLQTIITSALLVLGMSFAVSPLFVVDTVSADAKTEILGGANSADPGGAPTLENSFESIVSIMLFVIGAISVIVIVVGGILYVTSTGDAAKTKRAKDTILYAVVGLVVSILAYSIVKFVIEGVVG